MTISHELRTKLDQTVSEQEVQNRDAFLHKRYRCFKDVVNLFRTQWDHTNHRVVAGAELWDRILKHNWFNGAYYYNDKPEYMRLACVFGMTDVKVEGAEEAVDGGDGRGVDKAKDVIVISETVEAMETEEIIQDEIGEVNDEVNSPAIFPPPTVRCSRTSKLPRIENQLRMLELTSYILQWMENYGRRSKKGVHFPHHLNDQSLIQNPKLLML